MTDHSDIQHPDWVSRIKTDLAFELNADELLSSGAHPLEEVLSRLERLTSGQGGLLKASFTPGPLIKLVEKQGYDVWTDQDEDGNTIVFIAIAGDPGQGSDQGEASDQQEGPRFWLEGGMTHMDVRNLPPPGPMIEILKFLDSAAFDGALVTHTPHYPMHLIPELEARNIGYEVISDAVGDTLLCLTGE